MGFLGRLLTGDVLEDDELDRARADGVVLHLRRLKAAVAYDDYRAPGRRSNGKRQRTSGGVLVTTGRVMLWAGGVRQLDLDRPSLPSPGLEVTADPGVLQVAFSAEDFHGDRSGRVRIRLWTSEAPHVAELLTR
jgi:hypothetical protein